MLDIAIQVQPAYFCNASTCSLWTSFQLPEGQYRWGLPKWTDILNTCFFKWNSPSLMYTTHFLCTHTYSKPIYYAGLPDELSHTVCCGGMTGKLSSRRDLKFPWIFPLPAICRNVFSKKMLGILSWFIFLCIRPCCNERMLLVVLLCKLHSRRTWKKTPLYRVKTVFHLNFSP